MATPWSNWDWDARGLWVSSRLGPNGQVEYRYETLIPEYEAQAKQSVDRIGLGTGKYCAKAAEGADCNGGLRHLYSSAATSVATHASSPAGGSSDYSTHIATTYTNGSQNSNAYSPRTKPVLSGNTLRSICAPDDLSPSQNYYYHLSHNYSQPSHIYSQPSQTSHPRTGTVQPATDTLSSDYCVIEQPSRFFKIGRVFKMLWTEPANPRVSSEMRASHFSKTYLGGDAYTEVRRFVVIREGKGYSLCSAIHTYSGHGTLKRGVISEEHAAIYDRTQSVKVLADEKMIVQPFPMIVETNEIGGISPMSRINLGKIYTVEHYVRVCGVGRIDPAHVARLEQSSALGNPTPAILKGLSIPASDTTVEAVD